MNTNPLVSVIVPTFNRALVLPRAIASVLKQDYGNLELIVVDDGSTDETERVVAALSDRRISYYRVEANRGPAAARNTGIVLARGDLIAFQDSDDEWLPGKLRKQVRTIAEEGDSAGFSYSSFWHEVNGLQQQIPSVSQITRRGNTFHRLLYGNFIGMPTLVVTRSCLELAGAFDETMRSREDWDLMLRLATCRRGVHRGTPRFGARLVVGSQFPGDGSHAGEP
jgi:glycosyltransferase involved in cell wall biosynthesis